MMKEHHGSVKLQNIAGTLFASLFFTVLCFLVIMPFLTQLFGSFRPGRDIIRNGLSIGIDWSSMSLDNYKYLFFGKHDYFLWYKNSVLITVSYVVFSLVVSYAVAYGLAMYQFKFRNLFFLLVIATMMVPFEILMLPMYVEIISLGLIDTFAGVNLPGICNVATIFFFRQYMMALPKELIDAGRIDGANEYRISFTVMLPLCRPAFATMGILAAMGSWNNMLWPLLVLQDALKLTLPIGLRTLMTPYGNNYDLLLAGSTFCVLPIFILFLFFQKYFISGMTAGAIKG